MQLRYEEAFGLTPAARMALKASGTHAALDLAAVMAAEPEEGDEVPAGVAKPKGGNDGT